MREIKFRAKVIAKDPRQKFILVNKPVKEGEWVYGEIHLKSSTLPHIHVGTEYRYPIDVETVGQYTGFKDYYGKEIYEGDVIRSMVAGNNPVYHVIFWHPQSASFRARLVKQGPPVDHCGIHMEWINKFHKEVIGNVYDNKEFLEEE